MPRGGRNADDRLAGPQHPDPVRHQQAHEVEPGEGLVRQRMHPGERQRFVMLEFKHLDSPLAAYLADECADAAEAGVGIGERADQSAGNERPLQQANVAHRFSRR